MSKTPIDAASLTRKALYGMDNGWYEAFWYSERPAAKPSLLSRVIRQMGNAIAAVGVLALKRPARQRQSTAAVAHTRAEDLVVAGEG